MQPFIPVYKYAFSDIAYTNYESYLTEYFLT